MPTSQKLIPQKTSFLMPQVQKYSEWNKCCCAAHNIRMLANLLILVTQICLPLVLQHNHSLNTISTLDPDNFGLTRDKNVGPKTMEYISFWQIYILIWSNLYIFWINGSNLKRAQSKMMFWDSLQNTLTYSCFRLNC